MHTAYWADFVRQVLVKDPAVRPGAGELMQHPWCVWGQEGWLGTEGRLGMATFTWTHSFRETEVADATGMSQWERDSMWQEG